MRRHKGHCAARIGVFAVLVIATAARADMGPRLEEPRIIVHLTRQGRPLTLPLDALLLRPSPAEETQRDRWDDAHYPPLWKEIDHAALTDPDGTRWVPPKNYSVNPTVGPGIVTFRIRPEREPVPARVRVAFYLTDEKRVVLTDESPTRPYLTELAADIAPDGTATLRPTPTWSVTLVLGVLGENLRALPLALAATVALELPVVAVCAWWGGKWRHTLRRLLFAVVLGNLITVPLVWFASVYAKVGATLVPWPLLFLVAELWAVTFEGWLYSRIAAVPFATTLNWSALANGLTLLVGCCLVAFTL
jgi:hypothetical protein